MSGPVVARVSFKEKMLHAREEAIVNTVSRLLAEKGFDAMTVDEVATEVGIAKASLYKHFRSKEDLAAAAVVRMLRRAQDFLLSLPAGDAPLDKLRAVVRWTVELQLAGEMPSARSTPRCRRLPCSTRCTRAHATRCWCSSRPAGGTAMRRSSNW